MADRVLLVDDEPRVLDGIRRMLHGRYVLTTAESGTAALEALRASLDDGDPFAVVVSDMVMPGMSGAAFLSQARTIVPDAIPMILSGQADLVSTVEAVNSANLFRFLTKPCGPDDLTAALDAALRQHQLVRAERELLERTLGGAVQVLTDVLGLASPQAAHRTARVRTVVASVARHLDLESDWRLPIAAMLSQVGCISVPGPVLDKLDTGASLTDFELQMVLTHPETGRHLLRQIPRLTEIAEWVGSQSADIETAHSITYDDTKPGIAAGVLAAVSTFLVLLDAGESLRDIARSLHAGQFPEDLVAAVMAAVDELQPTGVPKTVDARGLLPGMVLTADVLTITGIMLVRRGEVVTEVVAARVTNFARSVGVIEPINVLVRGTGIGR